MGSSTPIAQLEVLDKFKSQPAPTDETEEVL